MDKYKIFENSRFYDYFNELKKHIRILEKKGVEVLFFQTPVADRIENLSEFEQERINTWEFDFNHISELDVRRIKKIYNEQVDVGYLKSLYEGAAIYERGGYKYLLDFQSQFVNIIGGRRITLNQPKEYAHTIYMFGQCTMRGTGVEDGQTIASYLQQMLNIDNDKYRVVNCAIGCGSDIHDDLNVMRGIDIKRGDLVILCTNLEIVPGDLFEKEHIRMFDCSVLFSRPHNYGEWFTDMTFHTNAIGNRVIAKYIKDVLINHNLLHEEKASCHCEGDTKVAFDDKEEIEQGLSQYLSMIRKYRRKGSAGAIVMNCNPFTNGHRYLIEKAAACVDVLYIFVVEEDKSFFPFADRFELVKKGTADMGNVIVIPSGKYIISLSTFPGYFNKEKDNEKTIDASGDLNIFCRYIAPCLNIKKRFVGEEPIDNITNQYNRQMESILKEYGIEFVEISRCKSLGEIISASKVRSYLQSKRFDKIEKMVPVTTFEYLKKKYGE